MSGTAELATEIFNLPARIGYPIKVGGLVEDVCYRNPARFFGFDLPIPDEIRG